MGVVRYSVLDLFKSEVSILTHGLIVEKRGLNNYFLLCVYAILTRYTHALSLILSNSILIPNYIYIYIYIYAYRYVSKHTRLRAIK